MTHASSSSGQPEFVAHSDDELHQEMPLRLGRPRKVREPFANNPLKHPLEKLLGLIGALLVMLFRKLFGSASEEKIIPPAAGNSLNDAPSGEQKDGSPTLHESLAQEHAPNGTEKPPQGQKPQATGCATPAPKNLPDELLYADPAVRIEQAQHEIFDWQLNAGEKIDPTTAESITLLVEHGHEFAKQVIAPMSYFTLQHLQDTIKEIAPGPTSELALVAGHIQDAMEGFKHQQKGQGR